MEKLFKVLQGIFISILCRAVKIKPTKDGLGYTAKGSQIFLNASHPYVKKCDDKKALFLEGIFVHEMLHQIFTPFNVVEEYRKTLPEKEQKVFHVIHNIVEDSRIEYFAPTVIGGELLIALRYTIKKVFEFSPPIEESMTAFSQVMNALIQFGDVGKTKGKFTFPDAENAFEECVPLFCHAIETPDGKDIIPTIKSIFELLRPLWEKDMEAAKDIFTSDKMHSGDGDGSPASGKPKSSRASVLRGKKMAKLKSSKAKDSEESDGEKVSGKGTVPKASDEDTSPSGSKKSDKTDSEESDEGSFSDTEDSVDEDSDDSADSEVAEDSKDAEDSLAADDSDDSDDSGDSDGDSDDDSEDSSDDSGEDSDDDSGEDSDDDSDDGSESDDSDDSDGDSEDSSDDSGEDSDDDSDDEIDDEDIEKALDELKRKVEDEEELEKTRKAIDDADVYNGDCCGSAPYRSTINVDKTKDGTSSYSATQYNKITCKYSLLISSITNQLKKIFLSDRGDSAHRSAGKLNIKRVNQGTSARVFDRKTAPSNKNDVSIMILVDESGSMDGSNIRAARETAVILYEVFHNLKVDLYIIGFTGDTTVDGVKYQNIHTHYIKWGWKGQKESLLTLDAKCENADGYAIRYASEILKRKNSRHKILLVLSDGEPCAYNYRGLRAVEDTRNAVLQAKKSSTVIGVLMGTASLSTVASVYEDSFINIANVEELPTRLPPIIKRKIKEL